jgi:DNA-binding CsgD family transcriptional regulator
MDDANFHQLLDRIYGAAVDPGLWPGVLGSLEEATGSHSAVLIRQNEETGVGEGIRAEPNPDATRLYYGYFATRNVFLQADNARAAVKSYRPGVLTDEHKVSKDALVRSEYYNEFMRRFDVHSVLMFRLAVEGMETVVVNLQRSKRRGGYGNSEIYFANAVFPHLSRAFDMGRKIASARVLIDGLTAAQDCSPHGLFVVGEDGRLRHANAAGRALLGGPGALRLLTGRLTASTPDRARRLDGLIGRAASADPAFRSSGSMTLPSPDRGANLLVTVIPAGGEASPVLSPGRSAIVCVSDPDARLSLSEQTLRDLFDLTPAETRVAHGLFDGLTSREMADRFGVSLNTIQAQLCRVLEKTGTHRQAELVRLLMRFVAPPE